MDVGEATDRLRHLPYADLGFARVDHHRPLRQGLAEAVYGPGKTADEAAAIVTELLAHGNAPVLLTRATVEQQEVALARNPGGTVTGATVRLAAARRRTSRADRRRHRRDGRRAGGGRVRDRPARLRLRSRAAP